MLESLNIADRTLREHPEIKPHQDKLSDDKVVESCELLAELSVERAHLGHLLYRETGETFYKDRDESSKTGEIGKDWQPAMDKFMDLAPFIDVFRAEQYDLVYLLPGDKNGNYLGIHGRKGLILYPTSAEQALLQAKEAGPAKNWINEVIEREEVPISKETFEPLLQKQVAKATTGKQTKDINEAVAGLISEITRLSTEQPKPDREVNPKRDPSTVSHRIPLEDELEAIKSGEFERVVTTKDEPKARIQERLVQVEAQIEDLVAYPQVVDSYRKNFRDKIELLKRAREVERLKQYQDKIEEQDEALLTRRQNDGQLSGPDEELLTANEARRQAIATRVLTLEADPQVETEERRRELLSYRAQLKSDRYVETPSVKDLLKTLTSRVHLGKPILLWGHTGTGKTETVLHLARKLTGQEPEIFSGSEEVTHYDLFGKSQLGPEGSYFQPGPATKALEEGRPLLIDEVDLVPHAIIGRIQHLLTRKPGDVITIQENSNESIKVPPGFIVLATGNIRSHKYRREEMDPAFLRRFWQTEVPYIPGNEAYDILVASLIDRRGSLTLGSPADVTDLENLVKGAKFTQEVFAGERTDFMGEGAQASRGLGASLEKATLSLGDLLAITRSWKAGNFQSPLGDHLLSEFVRSQTVKQDQLNLVKIFTLHNFFKGKSAQEFGIAGLTEEKLAAYRTGKR